MRTLAENFKLSTEILFNLLKKSNWTIIDIEYLDGYFVFDMGENSVVHFHVKECPNWIFAIWWKCEDDVTTGEFFCQYEPTMDKFKPSRSVYNQIIKFKDSPTEDNIYYDDIDRVLTYIHKNPIMAWGHDYYYWDYNLRYVPYIKALWNFINYKIYDFKSAKVNSILSKRFLRFTEKLFVGTIQDEINTLGWKYEIHDSGDCTYPRYDMQVELPNGYDKEYQDTGCFCMFEKDSVEQIKWNKKWNRYKKIALFFGIYLDTPIDACVTFWNKCEWEAYLKSND